MSSMFLLAIFSFMAGVVTILSPCVLPVLPIILSSSVGSGKQRPFGVILGFVLSFTFFTLFLSSLVRATGVSADALRFGSIVVIFGLGASLIFSWVQQRLEQVFTVFSRFAPSGNNRQGLIGGVLVGVSLGLLWTPCVGPILAAVISLALTGSVSGTAVLVTLAYAVGTSIPMFAIMYGGRSLLNKVPWLLKNTAQIQKAFGVVMMLTALAIFFNWDRQLQTWVLQSFPEYGVGLTKIEDHASIQDQLDELRGVQSADTIQIGQPMNNVTQTDQLPQLFTAPEFLPSGEWFNSEPLTMEQLHGKVVLVDFWTYSCINCIRTLPYLKQWHEEYADQGLVIVGVHSPEFEFEKSAKNLEKAISDFGLKYPVFQDNDFLTWRSYNNRYWPAKYLVDQTGVVRYSHFGEGDYTETENAIRQLLGIQQLGQAAAVPESSGSRQTPETYLGHKRAAAYVQTSLKPDAVNTLVAPDSLSPNGVALEGEWYLAGEFAESRSDKAQLNLNFSARQVFLVLELAEGSSDASVSVFLDGQPLPTEYQTPDFDQSNTIPVSAARKYDILQLTPDAAAQRHVLQLVFDPGVRAFAFTFGG